MFSMHSANKYCSLCNSVRVCTTLQPYLPQVSGFTRFSQSGISLIPWLLCKKSNTKPCLKYNVLSATLYVCACATLQPYLPQVFGNGQNCTFGDCYYDWQDCALACYSDTTTPCADWVWDAPRLDKNAPTTDSVRGNCALYAEGVLKTVMCCEGKPSDSGDCHYCCDKEYAVFGPGYCGF